MGKQKTSSASSATRKKHAKKAAGDDASGPSSTGNNPAQRAKGAGGKANTGAKGKGKKNAEPRVKVYIPPVKPQALQRDPVDVLRLASSLPPDLLVVFRKLTKKDAVTRRRALEELMGGWFDKLKRGKDAYAHEESGEAEEALAALEIALPAWCYHFPALTLHSSRRIRYLAVTTQAAFLDDPSLRDMLWSFLKGPTMDPSRLRGYYGVWMLSAYDVDRQVSQVAGTTWNIALQSFGLGEGNSHDENDGTAAEGHGGGDFTQRLESFILHAIMHPQSLYAEFYPASSAVQKPHDDPPEQSEEECAGDRDGRIRIAGLAALKAHIESGHSSLTSQTSTEDEEFSTWGKIPPYMDEPALHHDQDAAGAFESFGTNQVGIRRAGWTLVHLLAADYLDKVRDLVPLISTAVLRSIWVEPDAGVRVWSRDGLVTFLSNVPGSWNMAAAHQHPEAENDSSDDNEGHESKTTTAPPNPAYEEFLQFLRLGCGGSATQFYPAIVLIVSKLPQSLCPQSKASISALFEAFWAAVDGHALNVLERGSAPNMAFVSAHLETLVLLVGRLHQHRDGDTATDSELGEEVVRTQVASMWEYYATKKLAVRSGEFGSVLGKTLLRLQSIDTKLFDSAWNIITAATEQLYEGSPDGSDIASNIDFVAVFRSLYTLLSATNRKDDVVSLLSGLTRRSLDRIIQLEDVSSRLCIEHLEFMMRDMSGVIQEQHRLSNGLRELFSKHLKPLSTHLSPANFSRLVMAYLFVLQDDQLHRQKHWNAVLSLIGDASTPKIIQRDREILKNLLVINETDQFKDLKGEGALSAFVSILLQQDDKDLAIQLIRQHEQFLSLEDLELCATVSSGQVEEASNLVLRQAGYQIPNAVQDAVTMLLIMQEVAPQTIHRLSSTLSGPLFVLGCVYPLLNESSSRVSGLNFWDEEGQGAALDSLVQAIRSWILDPDLCVSSESLLRAAMMIGGKDATWILNSILPSKEILEQLFEGEVIISPDPLLAAGDQLVPEGLEDQRTYSFDKQHLSSYVRLTWALIFLVSTDRQLAKSNTWILKHALLLQQMAEDRLQSPGGQSSAFGKGVSRSFLLKVVESVQLLTVYLFSDISSSDLPHALMIGAIEGMGAATSNDIVGFIIELCISSVKFDAPQLARITRSVLSHALRGVSVADADKWLSLSRKIKKTTRNTELAIISSVVSAGVETPLLTRMRNEAASDLTSVPASKANSQGSPKLQLLLVLAPLPDSDVVFIPSQRALMVTQTIEKWIGSDEDIEPVIESQTLALFNHLAPILQSIMGRHWDFAFDLIENTLENSSLGDPDSLVQLSRALDLVSTIIRFGSTNKQLNAAWKTRWMAILRLVRDLISPSEESQPSVPQQETCRSQAISILQEPPEGVIEAESLSKMIHLLRAPSLETQRGAYPLVRSAAQKYSEKIVLEVGLNPAADVDARLPPELIDLLETVGLWDESEEAEDQINERASARFGTLLGWMTVLDAFENTSFRVRSSYVEQLRNSGVIQNALIPGICDLLQLGKPGRKPLKLDLWEVDTFIISLYEHDSIRVLAAHVYYRALTAIPSLIRTWWTDCKDRQLSSAFAASTATYFSPVLVASELANLRETSGTGGREKLEDDALSIKVSQAISEVSVVYLVDEQQMEMAVKLPAEYPLKLVEVRDVRRVGVAEEKWRGWLFAVQQIISTQNGHIADALALFKKNVTLHFEGQVECAICYSIISVTDLQLPTKPCKTCKNRFHASCLYKWFKSSSSSSCPLCRSDIF